MISLDRAVAACDLLAHYCTMEPWSNCLEIRAAVATLCEFVQDSTTWMDGGDSVEDGTSQGRMVIEVAI